MQSGCWKESERLVTTRTTDSIGSGWSLSQLQHHKTPRSSGQAEKMAHHANGLLRRPKAKVANSTLTHYFQPYQRGQVCNNSREEVVIQDSFQLPACAYGRNSLELLSVSCIVPQKQQEKVPCAFCRNTVSQLVSSYSKIPN